MPCRNSSGKVASDASSTPSARNPFQVSATDTHRFSKLTVSATAFADGTFSRIAWSLSYGFVAGPGAYETTVTRPDLFRVYLTEQIRLLIENHHVPVEI